MTSGADGGMGVEANPSELVFTTMTDANGVETVTLGPDTQIVTTVDGRQLAVRNGIIQGEVQLAPADGQHPQQQQLQHHQLEGIDSAAAAAMVQSGILTTNEEGIPVVVSAAADSHAAAAAESAPQQSVAQ